MYHVMAIANYEDRFVIPEHAPRVRREHVQRARRLRLLVRQRLLRRHGETSLFGSEKKRTIPIKAEV